ncbi:hypothetical protein GCM10009127_24980 [Alteraurantiacibacter aestuarii]|uniref:cupin-like domain-containing protein n=1 Tax=Alteraurantiacibacter aestuarii TaxID=650004 RepID=UPI0031DA0A19
MTVFPPNSHQEFAAHYPEAPCKLVHALGTHRLMSLESLAALADFLPDDSVECNPADLPIGVDGKPQETGLSGGETIRAIESAHSWVMLKRAEQHPAYRQLLSDLLDELRPQVEPRTGAMMNLQCFIFITSAGGVTPFHFDPEHNILMQLRGSKVLTVFPAGDERFAPHEKHEAYHRGGGAELPWNDEMATHGTRVSLQPGDALFIPVMAPHFVKNGNEVSVSLSITWRSEWSFAEADARAFNSILRNFGLNPKPPRRWPGSNNIKALAWRAARRIPGID